MNVRYLKQIVLLMFSLAINVNVTKIDAMRPGGARPPKEIVDFVKQLAPVHRCKEGVFQSILHLGALLSLATLEKIQVDPDYAKHMFFELASQHPLVIEAAKGRPSVERLTRYYAAKIDNLGSDWGDEITQSLHFVYQGFEWLKSTRVGRNFEGDVAMKLTNVVFTVLGKNNFDYGPIHIELQPALLTEHARAFVTPVASSLYYKGQYAAPKGTPLVRKWVDEGKLRLSFDSFSKAAFERESMKFTPETVEVLAHELMLRTDSEDADTVKSYVKTCEGHNAFHAYFPGVILIKDIQRIFVPKSCRSIFENPNRKFSSAYSSLLAMMNLQESPAGIGIIEGDHSFAPRPEKRPIEKTTFVPAVESPKRRERPTVAPATTEARPMRRPGTMFTDADYLPSYTEGSTFSLAPEEEPIPKRFVPTSVKKIHCRVAECTEEHAQHFCKTCGDKDSDHYSRNCTPAVKHCHVTDCKEEHEKHYCRTCKNADSDHRASDCPKK